MHESTITTVAAIAAALIVLYFTVRFALKEHRLAAWRKRLHIAEPLSIEVAALDRLDPRLSPESENCGVMTPFRVRLANYDPAALYPTSCQCRTRPQDLPDPECQLCGGIGSVATHALIMRLKVQRRLAHHYPDINRLLLEAIQRAASTPAPGEHMIDVQAPAGAQPPIPRGLGEDDIERARRQR